MKTWIAAAVIAIAAALWVDDLLSPAGQRVDRLRRASEELDAVKARIDADNADLDIQATRLKEIRLEVATLRQDQS